MPFVRCVEAVVMSVRLVYYCNAIPRINLAACIAGSSWLARWKYSRAGEAIQDLINANSVSLTQSWPSKLVGDACLRLKRRISYRRHSEEDAIFSFSVFNACLLFKPPAPLRPPHGDQPLYITYKPEDHSVGQLTIYSQYQEIGPVPHLAY